MKKLLVSILLVAVCSGCSFLREMEVVGKVKDGQYGIAKGNGDVVYRSTTAGSFLCKPIELPEDE